MKREWESPPSRCGTRAPTTTYPVVKHVQAYYDRLALVLRRSERIEAEGQKPAHKKPVPLG
jgi:hypothetical protein